MNRPAAPGNRAVALELLEMAERGQRIPAWLLAFALHEDWSDIDCRRPAVAAIDLLIAAEVADGLMARLRQATPPR